MNSRPQPRPARSWLAAPIHTVTAPWSSSEGAMQVSNTTLRQPAQEAAEWPNSAIQRTIGLGQPRQVNHRTRNNPTDSAAVPTFYQVRRLPRAGHSQFVAICVATTRKSADSKAEPSGREIYVISAHTCAFRTPAMPAANRRALSPQTRSIRHVGSDAVRLFCEGSTK